MHDKKKLFPVNLKKLIRNGKIKMMGFCRKIFSQKLGALACLVLLGPIASRPCAAAPEEIQVYMDDLSATGHFGLDVHNNYVLSGAGTPSYMGEQPPRHLYRLTPEFYYGISQTIELGLYVLTTLDAQGKANIDGSKVRVKYVAPHDADGGFFWGMNVEVGRTSVRVSELPWNLQLKGILGYRASHWTVAINPNLDRSMSKGGGPVMASLDGKVAYGVTEKTQLGFETYNELGPLSKIQRFNKNSKTVYAVIDHEFAGVDVNAGVGRGITGEADRWVMKAIIGTHF